MGPMFIPRIARRRLLRMARATSVGLVLGFVVASCGGGEAQIATPTLASVSTVTTAPDDMTTSLATPPSLTAELAIDTPMDRIGGECPYPAFLPTYLPWTTEGEEPPTPTKEHFAGEARFIWQGSPKAANALVILKVLNMPPLDHTDLDIVPVRVNDNPGYLSFGGNFSDDVADHAIIWQGDRGSDACNTVVLVYWDPQTPSADGEEEILKIAESFQPTPDP